MRQTAAKGSTAKHTGAGKHGRTAKHHPARQKPGPAVGGRRQTAVGKHPGHAKARGLARGDAQRDLLRSWPVTGGEAGPRHPPGASLLADWDCCSAEALGASLRLAGWPVADEDVLALHVAAGGSQAAGVPILAALEAATGYGVAGVRLASFTPVDLRGLHMFRAGLILGLELPGPHAVTVAHDGCWLSWGAHCDPGAFPDALVEEAWAVVWP